MEDASAFDVLRKRPPIGWLRERDIDLLLCSELHIDGPLRRYFADVLDVNHFGFEGAWVSHNDLDGESDLVIAFTRDAEPLIALVENKIAATFQPEQVSRYRARARRWQATVPNSRVRLVLIAPSEYFGRTGSEEFDLRIGYEQLADRLMGSPDPRSVFLAEALLAGVDAYRQGYTAVPNQTVTDVWTAIWCTALEEWPLLNMEQPTPKPSRSSFIYFRRPSGFASSDLRRVALVLKGAHGNVDLQFSRTSTAELEKAIGHLLEQDMTIAKAAGSASIRIKIPTLDFGGSASLQDATIRTGLTQAERLRAFFVEKQLLNLVGENTHRM